MSELPRIRVNIRTGEKVLEYKQFFENRPGTYKMEYILGVIDSTVSETDGVVCKELHPSRAIIRGITCNIITGHSYEELVDFLYSTISEGDYD